MPPSLSFRRFHGAFCGRAGCQTAPHHRRGPSRLALYVQSIFSLMASLLSVNAPLDVPMCPPCAADGACGNRTPTHTQRAAHTRQDFTGRLLWPEPWGSRPMSVRHRKEGTLAFPKRPSCRLYDENWSFNTRRRGCGGFAGTLHERGGRWVGSDFPRPVSPMWGHAGAGRGPLRPSYAPGLS